GRTERHPPTAAYLPGRRRPSRRASRWSSADAFHGLAQNDSWLNHADGGGGNRTRVHDKPGGLSDTGQATRLCSAPTYAPAVRISRRSVAPLVAAPCTGVAGAAALGIR